MIRPAAIARLPACAAAALVLSGCQALPDGGGLAGNGAAAARSERGAFQEDKRTRELYLAVIAELIAHDKVYAALAHLDEFERLHGPSDESRKLRGDAWLATGATANAQKEYAAIAEGKLAGYGRHGLGRVAAASADWSLASLYFEQAVQSQPTNTQFLDDFGSALFQLGRLDEAAFQLRKALDLAPMDAVAKETLGRVLEAHQHRIPRVSPMQEAQP